MSDQVHEARQVVTALAFQVLDELGLEHTTNSDTPYIVRASFKDEALEADIAIFCGQHFISLHLVCKNRPPIDRLLSVYEAVNAANRSLPVGGFELNRDGRFRLKAGLLINDTVTVEVVKQLVSYCFLLYKRFAPGIEELFEVKED